jgi:parallel beta-helix repeat protein
MDGIGKAAIGPTVTGTSSRRAMLASVTGGLLAGAGAISVAGSAGRADAATVATPDWLNVVIYEADPTGATDSTSAIQAALNAVPSGGGVVYIPAGTYLVSASLTMASGTMLVGDGWASELFMAADANLEHIADASDTSECCIRDLQINGNGTNQTGGGTSMVGGDSSVDLTVRNVWVHNSWGQGIYFGGAAGALIEGCYATANGVGSVNGFGFGLNDGAAYNRITGCYTSGNLEGGYSVYGSSAANAAHDTVIVGCTAYTESEIGFNIYNAYNCTVSGCNAVDCGTAGIQVEYEAANVTVTGCTVSSDGGVYGINIIPTGNGCVVSGCTSTGSGTGINADNTTGVTITGNQCSGNVNTGIYLGHNSGVTNFTVAGNTCNDNGQQGIITGSICGYGTISGNTCCGNTSDSGARAGIALGGTTTYVAITGNTCCNQGYGIHETSGSAVNYCVYTGNVCHGNGSGQLVTSGSDDVTEANISS